MVLLVLTPIVLASEDSGFFRNAFSSITGNVVDQGEGVQRNGNFLTGYKYKEYDLGEERVIIDDGSEVLAKVRLVSSKDNKVSAGEDVMVAEFLFEDFDFGAGEVMSKVDFYDIKEEMKKIRGKNFRLKYLEGGEWIQFNKFSDLPSENIQVGLFTDTVFGEAVEWIPEMFNFKISEWASYEVTAGPENVVIEYGYPYEIDSEKIDSNHFLLAYKGEGSDGYAVVTEVNTANGTILNGTHHEFETSYVLNPSLGQIDSTHYLVTYGYSSTGRANVLTVDTGANSVTSGSNMDFYSTARAYDTQLVKISSNRFLVVYEGSTNIYSNVLAAYANGTISEIGSDTQIGTDQPSAYPGLIELDTNKFLYVYGSGVYAYGYVVYAYENGTITAGSRQTLHTAASGAVNDIGLSKYNSTLAMMTLEGEGEDGYAASLVIGGGTISAGTALEFDDTYGRGNSLQYINGTGFLNFYARHPYVAHSILEIDSGLDVIEKVDSVFGGYVGAISHTSLGKINSTHFVEFYWDSAASEGYATMLTVDYTPDTIGINSTEYNYDAGQITDNFVLAIDENHSIVVYDNNDDDLAYAKILTVDSTLWNVTGNGSAYNFWSALHTYGHQLINMGENYFLNVFGEVSGGDLEAVILKAYPNNDSVVRISSEPTYVLDYGSVGFNRGAIHVNGDHYFALDGVDGNIFTAYINGTINSITRSSLSVGEKIEKLTYPNFVVSEAEKVYPIHIYTNNNSFYLGAGLDVPAGFMSHFDTERIDDTHMLYAGSNSNVDCRAMVINATGGVLYNHTYAIIDDENYCYYPSIQQISSTQYVMSYTGGDNLGLGLVITINESDWNVSAGAPFIYDSGATAYNSLAQIDVNHYINAYQGSDLEGYATIFSLIGGAAQPTDTCTCTGLNTDWPIDLTDFCVITTDCDLGTGILSFIDIGNATISAAINTSDMTAPGSGGIVYVTSDGRIYVG